MLWQGKAVAGLGPVNGDGIRTRDNPLPAAQIGQSAEKECATIAPDRSDCSGGQAIVLATVGMKCP